ncbi:hypothetical protein OYC64_016546 [Pagothenia borchgrevinki]|uniref:Uncharacterized protein n=1 Tax=Pagothenia borchgrevinki TaxID=8213 RepID=A0ABD2HPG0_PAGBO
MALPFDGFELTFIVFAFFIVSLFSLASICIKPEAKHTENCGREAKKSRPLNKKQRVINKQAGKKP